MTKTLSLLFGVCFALTSCAAQPLNEKETISKSHIDFSTQFVYFVIHGQIEIDGHIFVNDTRTSPVIFQANLDGVTIIDTLTKQTYTHRKCETAGCKIVHLLKVAPPVYKTPWQLNTFPLLYNDLNIVPCDTKK